MSQTLTQLVKEFEELKEKSVDLSKCRATLYVNFINKKTYGVQITYEQAEKWSTHQLLYEILVAIKEGMDKCSS